MELTAEQINDKCTGERYSGQRLHFLPVDGWHGKFGHFNLLKLDHDSVITDFGKHDRVCAHITTSDVETFRVDHLWGLGMPSPKQVIKVARKNQELKGKWEHVKTETDENGFRSWVTFRRI
jgi:hypothetical protein